MASNFLTTFGETHAEANAFIQSRLYDSILNLSCAHSFTLGMDLHSSAISSDIIKQP